MATILRINEKNAFSKLKKLQWERHVFIYPTETCYGLGCSLKNIKGIERVIQIKKRNSKKCFSVLVYDLKMAEEYCFVDSETKTLVNSFMPGPLVVVVKKKPNVPDLVCKEKVGFRISGNKIARELCRIVNAPIISTSANLKTEGELYTGKEVIERFENAVDLIIDAGELPKRKPSTIFDVKERKVLREGPISKEEIFSVLSERK